MSFQQGTDRGGFKRDLLKAFKSAHKAATFPPSSVAKPRLPQGLNADGRAHGLMPGGQQAFKIPTSNKGENVLDGGPHPSPAATARGPVNHNNDPRRTGFQTNGPAPSVGLMPGSATNGHGIMPKGHQANKIKTPQGLNADQRSLRGR